MKIILLTLTFTCTFLTMPLEKVSFTLLNRTAKSIPLKIPGVMNPNLSPFSNSGVTLKIGQEIYFKWKGKKQLLLTVTEDLADRNLVVNELIKKRVKELKLKKRD